MAEQSPLARAKNTIRRRITSPGKTTSDLVRQFRFSPSKAQTLPTRRSVVQDTDNSPPPARPLIRTIRYEDTDQGPNKTIVPQTPPSNRALSVSWERRRAIRSEFRSNPELPHISEHFDFTQLPALPHIDTEIPSKSSPSFATKRNSVSGSFNSLKRAGTKLVRRGIQGVLPVTPSKTSEQSPSQTPDKAEDVSNILDQDSVIHSSNLRSSQRLDGYTPPRIGIIEDTLQSRRSILRGFDDSDETARTFYDAQESLITTTKSRPVMTKDALAIRSSGISVSRSQLLLKHDSVEDSARQACVTIPEQPLEQAIPMEDIIERINRRQSVTGFPGKEDFEIYISRRFSRSSFTTHEAPNKTDLASILDHAPTTADQNTSGPVKVSDKKVLSIEQRAPTTSKLIEQATRKDSRAASGTLFDVVREELEIDDDDSSILILDPVEAVQVSTRGVNFRNAHKNYFPAWASQLKRNGRPYKQEEIVRKILDST